MVEVTREQLENALILIDDNNPKYELNFLYVDNENIVSTNTRGLCIARHRSGIEKPFYIHKKVVKKAISDKDAKYYHLSENTVVSIDRDSQEIMSYHGKYNSENMFYPDYKRIIPEEFNKKHSFLENNQINGIFAINKVHINPKWLPKFKSGFIHIKQNNLPVAIMNENENITFVVMPLIDTFKEFDSI
jgi:hypothetical protein